MRYLSVCSGIEAATVAWHSFGWEPVAFSEIEAFPSSVLAHHYPDTPNWGDMERFDEWPEAGVDVLVGGTPCQSFSVAGLRKGLDDPRGNLALVYLAIAEQYRPCWLVWENVPGVLSWDGGRAMGALLGGMAKLGYGFAWRVLDAQYFGLAQRRKRVFVVGYLGDWRPPAGVLLEPEGMRGDSPPRRESGQRVAASLTRGADSSGQGGYAGRRQEDDVNIVSCDVSPSLRGQEQDPHRDDAAAYVAHTLNGRGFDASEDGTGRVVPLVPDVCGAINSAGGHAVPGNSVQDAGVGQLIPFDTTQITSKDNRSQPRSGDPAHPLAAGAHAPAVAFAHYQDSEYGCQQYDTAAIRSGRIPEHSMVREGMSVRRLKPRECERLQGFPDDYTLIPYRNGWAKDGPRYKALGNSMAVPVMRWIGGRIASMDEVLRELEAA